MSREAIRELSRVIVDLELTLANQQTRAEKAEAEVRAVQAASQRQAQALGEIAEAVGARHEISAIVAEVKRLAQSHAPLAVAAAEEPPEALEPL